MYLKYDTSHQTKEQTHKKQTNKKGFLFIRLPNDKRRQDKTKKKRTRKQDLKTHRETQRYTILGMIPEYTTLLK